VRIAILTPRPDYSAEWRWAYDVESAAIASAGADVRPHCWSEPVDPHEFDLVLPLVAWGYHHHFGRWMEVLDEFERAAAPVRNPIPVLRWNSDKAYLAELWQRGIATVPTEVVDHLDEAALERVRSHFGCSDIVVKPPISASAYRTFRLRGGDPLPESVRGLKMMAQPWLETIVETGEWSLIFFDGQLSHTVSKVPVPGEFRVQPEYGGIIELCDAPSGAEELALAALAAAPASTLYARVDVVVGNDGTLQIMELELVEPAFFLAQAPEAAPNLARAVVSVAEAL
jgi:glutathione synthase/RimK-type ligase-like ATP-grasp enzyme